MKKQKLIVVMILILMLTMPVIGAAEDGFSPTPEPSATPAEQSETITVPLEWDDSVIIEPDSLAYPLKLLFESASISLTFNEQNRTQLMIRYADRRMVEAQLMGEKGDEALAAELVEAGIKMLAKANDLAYNGAKATDFSEEIVYDIMRSGDDVIITLEMSGFDDEGALLKMAEKEVTDALATQAFLSAKDDFFEAKDVFKEAQETYKAAKETGDEAAIAAAYDAMIAAEAEKDEAEAVKDAFEAAKEDIKGGMDDEDDDEDADGPGENNGKALGKDKQKDKTHGKKK